MQIMIFLRVISVVQFFMHKHIVSRLIPTENIENIFAIPKIITE